MNLFLSPHSDDAALFGAFTLIREKPLVVTVTDSWVQWNRGEKISADMRWKEDQEAMKILGCPILLLGVRDDAIHDDVVRNALYRFSGFDTVYAPAIQGGNPHHDLIGRIAKEMFPNVRQYATYTKENLTPIGNEGIIPTREEVDLKNKALQCYQSQLNLPATRPHFEAVFGRTEWFI